MRPGTPALLTLPFCLLLLAATPGAGQRRAPLPERMADTGGGTQLLTAVAPGTGATTGTLT